jgi:hypothetical protein
MVVSMAQWSYQSCVSSRRRLFFFLLVAVEALPAQKVLANLEPITTVSQSTAGCETLDAGPVCLEPATEGGKEVPPFRMHLEAGRRLCRKDETGGEGEAGSACCCLWWWSLSASNPVGVQV